MSESRFVPIGQLLKTVGTIGEIRLHVEEEFLDDLDTCGHFFIKKRGSYEPFFIDYFKDSADLVVKIEEIESPEAASALNLKQVYLRREDIRSKSGKSIASMTQLIGYEVFDHGERVGTIEGIQQMPHQVLAYIELNGKTILIPLHESLIASMNKNLKKIYMELPEGILNL